MSRSHSCELSLKKHSLKARSESKVQTTLARRPKRSSRIRAAYPLLFKAAASSLHNKLLLWPSNKNKAGASVDGERAPSAAFKRQNPNGLIYSPKVLLWNMATATPCPGFVGATVNRKNLFSRSTYFGVRPPTGTDKSGFVSTSFSRVPETV
jgi:hypothetical protein